MSDELKPCPFCGGVPFPQKVLRSGYEHYPNDPDRWAHSMRCRSCAAEGPWLKSATAAKRDWNRREPDPRLTALEAWLESRGLPKDAPVNTWHKWRWVVYSSGLTDDRRIIGSVVQPVDVDGDLVLKLRASGHIIRWDRATPEQRAAALRIAAERKAT